MSWHRLERRRKSVGDETRWRAEQAALPPEHLLVRLADRLHNLRDLGASPNLDRRRRFLQSLRDFHLPLADAARGLGTQLEAMHARLHTECVRLSLVRWVLAPRTTWARRLAAEFGPGMDAG